MTCSLRCLRLIAGLIVAAAALPAVASIRAPDETMQLIRDPRSGLALFGYDPVSYHADGVAKPGRPEHQAVVNGVHWRFASAANMAAFVRDPDVYLPLFGGYDARGIGEGRMVFGEPTIFAMFGGRTVLFRTEADRAAFAADAALRARALKDWPRVASQLAGH
jgi:hypothetical protein